jgi:hypothetical protein
MVDVFDRRSTPDLNWQNKLDYWPSTNKWCNGGKFYRGSLTKALHDLIHKDDVRIANEPRIVTIDEASDANDIRLPKGT